MILEHRDNPDAFRGALRDWLATAVPRNYRESESARLDLDVLASGQSRWMRELADVGLAAPHWPQEAGGAGLTLPQLVIVADEMARADAPSPSLYIIALQHAFSTLDAWGTSEQRQRYLPGITAGDLWCQGFSEPEAGSDLASLLTKAERVGDCYVVTGQKIWSSYATFARYCLLLVRTDSTGRKHEGLTYLILDMQTPGLTVRPIRQATGEAEFCELFLDGVCIPVQDRIGPEGQGWQVAQATLSAERGLKSFERVERMCWRVEAFWRESAARNAAWLHQPELSRGLVDCFGELQALRRMIRQLLRESTNGIQSGSITASLVKVTETELRLKLADLLVRSAGIEAQYEVRGSPLAEYIGYFGGRIAAGTNEIQRNIIAERGLGLPR